MYCDHISIFSHRDCTYMRKQVQSHEKIDARTERNIKSQCFQLQHPQTTNADQTDTSRSFSGCVNRSTSITTPQCLGYSSHRANKSTQTLLTQSSAINKKLSPSWEAFGYFLQLVTEVRPSHLILFH